MFGRQTENKKTAVTTINPRALPDTNYLIGQQVTDQEAEWNRTHLTDDAPEKGKSTQTHR